MIDDDMHLVKDLRSKDTKEEAIRTGFGRGFVEAGRRNSDVVGICADLVDSVKMGDFAKAYPNRFIEAGIAEQNIVATASGLAAMGKIPFAGSYAAFSPGRSWEQIHTTVCLNDQPVKLIASHAGLTVGPDGATHQALEDIATMRVLSNMVVIVPCDSVEAEKATIAMATDPRPNYLRMAREATPILTTDKTPFEIGKAYVFRKGTDITIISTGTMTYQSVVASDILRKDGISAEVVHVPTIKPLDEKTILASVKKTGLVITAEEAEIIGGLGGAIAELLGEKCPTLMRRIGMRDQFGESGEAPELFKHFGLDAMHIAMAAHELTGKK